MMIWEIQIMNLMDSWSQSDSESYYSNIADTELMLKKMSHVKQCFHFLRRFLKSRIEMKKKKFADMKDNNEVKQE